MSLNKKYLKTKPVCKVSFEIQKEAAKDATKIYVVGEFNEWNKTANPMKRRKNGSFVSTIDLSPGKEYQFRYLIDDSNWENDHQADKYVPNCFGDSENSVVVV